jgi:hypothetical protein
MTCFLIILFLPSRRIAVSFFISQTASVIEHDVVSGSAFQRALRQECYFN